MSCGLGYGYGLGLGCGLGGYGLGGCGYGLGYGLGGYGLGYGLGGYGYGLGLGACGCGIASCLQCFCPSAVDGCPVQIECGPIYPELCNVLCNPCYGGISVPACSAKKLKCCESSLYGCNLIPREKNTSQWLKPGLASSSSCGCSCGC